MNIKRKFAMGTLLAAITLQAQEPATFLNLSCSVAPALAPEAEVEVEVEVKQPAAKKPVVQIALLLDTSDSMSGLIQQAKSQLWRIVNEFINAKQSGQRPELEVALFEYGKQSLSAKDGFVRLIVPLTNDLDKISEELFALKTNGGDEYCGWVIRDAVSKLFWSKDANAFKAIFIAGNEPFSQGPVAYDKSCKAAVEKGIVVNTIHCGDESAGVNGHWRDGALAADGKFMSIDQNKAVVHYEAPQDKEIAQLGVELNKTYIAFGSAGQANLQRQSAQDANSLSLAAQGSSVQRAVNKASALYHNGAWDLVDACKEKSVDLTKVKKEELPTEMQKLNDTERKAYVEAKTSERAKLQSQINQLNVERSKYVEEQMKKNSQTNTLDQVMITAIREQATKRNYRFE